MLALALLTAPALMALKPYCQGPTRNGCNIQAHYFAAYNYTEWDMACDDGYSTHGQMGGNQTGSLCS